jgi:hypothetical protein
MISAVETRTFCLWWPHTLQPERWSSMWIAPILLSTNFFYQNADVMLAALAGVAVGNDQRRSEVGRPGSLESDPFAKSPNRRGREP